MPKPVALTADDLTLQKKPRRDTAARPRGQTRSEAYMPLQFRLDPEFVERFKDEARARRMKLNELFVCCFNEFMKREGGTK